MKMEHTDCSETSAYKIQTPGNYPKESIQHTQHGESLKLRTVRSYPSPPQQCDGRIDVRNNMLRHNIGYVTTAKLRFLLGRNRVFIRRLFDRNIRNVGSYPENLTVADT